MAFPTAMLTSLVWTAAPAVYMGFIKHLGHTQHEITMVLISWDPYKT